MKLQEARKRSEAAKLAAITRQAKHGVRLTINFIRWDEECGTPPDVYRMFRTAAQARDYLEAVTNREEGADYDWSMEPV